MKFKHSTEINFLSKRNIKWLMLVVVIFIRLSRVYQNEIFLFFSSFSTRNAKLSLFTNIFPRESLYT